MFKGRKVAESENDFSGVDQGEYDEVDLKGIFSQVWTRFNKLRLRRAVQPVILVADDGSFQKAVENDGIAKGRPVSSALGNDPFRSLNQGQVSGNFFESDAIGTRVQDETKVWKPVTPVTRQAAADGSHTWIEVVPAVATKKIDLVFYLAGGTAGGATAPAYTVNVRENADGSDVAPVFSYVGPMFAGFPYGPFHVINQAVNRNIGIGAGAAGTWAASAYMTMWGFYREI
jgi:hypothetical protein